MSLRSKFQNASVSPEALMLFHFWVTLAWAVLLVPSLLWWKNSIPWLVTMSVWANLAGHFSAWQAARGEVKQDEETEENHEHSSDD